MERTLVIIKPDSFSKKVVGKIIDVIENKDFKIIASKFVRITEDQAKEFYVEHTGKPFYEGLVSFMTSNPCLIMVLEKENAIKNFREVVGATNPLEADDGTIRKLYATNKGYNGIHASDSQPSSDREIAIFFKDEEIFPWEIKEYKEEE